MYKFLGGGISRNVGNGISGISRTATARNFVHHAGNRSAGVWELKTGERIYAVGFARLTKFCHQFLLTICESVSRVGHSDYIFDKKFRYA